jgi:hypothetical protein
VLRLLPLPGLLLPLSELSWLPPPQLLLLLQLM